MSAAASDPAPPAHAAPDPIGFALEALTARGALVERDDGGATALLPRDLAAALGQSEDVRLELEPRGSAIPCGMGSPLLERLVAEARERTPVAWASVDRDPPRPQHAAALAGRLVVRNGLADVGQVTFADGRYVAATFAFVAEGDERHEGIVTVVADAERGGFPPSAFARMLDVRASALRPERGPLFDAHTASAWLARRAQAEVAARVSPVAGALARRHARDHAQIVSYFDSLVVEARSLARRNAAATVEAKVAHLLADRDAKLRDLPSRFALRVHVRPAAAVCVVARVGRVVLRVRRRKGEREIVVQLAPEADSIDALACDACGGSTLRPALCDDALHVLCETCVPAAQGRPACEACRRPAADLDVLVDHRSLDGGGR